MKSIKTFSKWAELNSKAFRHITQLGAKVVYSEREGDEKLPVYLDTTFGDVSIKLSSLGWLKIVLQEGKWPEFNDLTDLGKSAIYSVNSSNKLTKSNISICPPAPIECNIIENKWKHMSGHLDHFHTEVQ